MESAASGGFATGILRITALYFLGMRRLDFESPQQVYTESMHVCNLILAHMYSMHSDLPLNPGVTPSQVGTGQVAVPLSRVPPSSFEGCNVEEVREWAAQCRGMAPSFPHSIRTALGMAARRGLVEQCRDTIPRRCQRVGVAGILAFDPSTHGVPEHLMLWSGE
jgi:hypothetical protein